MNHGTKFLLLSVTFLTTATRSFCDTADDFIRSGLAKKSKGDVEGAKN